MANKTKHLGFRFPLSDANLLQNVCKSRGEDVSDFVRRATKIELARLSYLSSEEKKALGVADE